MPPLSPEQIEALRAQLLDGRKIEAIRDCRALTGWGLKEAKDFVEGLVGPAGQTAAPPAAESLEDSVRALVLRGRKIEAIREYRKATGCGLAAAKDHVEEIARELLGEDAVPAKRGCALLLALVPLAWLLGQAGSV